MDREEPKEHQGVFIHQGVAVPELPDEPIIVTWIQQLLRQESRRLGCIYYIFLDDASLLKINKEYLKHNMYTDIITFPYLDDPVEAEIYISADRVRDNAKKFGVSVREEFLRVMAHGVLHLCGWSDKTEAATRMMRQREGACLALLDVGQSPSSISPS